MKTIYTDENGCLVKCIRNGKELSIDEIKEIYDTPDSEGGDDK